ncbi:MAG TPA: DUF5996 family protein [Ktedonobacterales bacterium]|nr:DUF5996 family protein [Ktedonobacterales bacterium]
MAQQTSWPDLPYAAWRDTCETLHLWTQIVGKVRLALTPAVNHWWHVPLYVSARGLTTSSIPYERGLFEMTFDFLDHQLVVATSEGTGKSLPLIPRSVAAFYRELMASLRQLNISVAINPLPSEIPNAIPCDEDETHAAYDPEYARRFWQALIRTEGILRQHRTRFIGKSSPIHFFWGSFDMALTFFSGRPAPERPGADNITREAYSHEVISCGFWPGSESFPHAAFYAYSAPSPDGLADVPIQPTTATFDRDLGEFLLPYDAVRVAPDPDGDLRAFFASTYEAAATLAHWDRAALERAAD